jgi:hypothetical protein
MIDAMGPVRRAQEALVLDACAGSPREAIASAIRQTFDQVSLPCPF